jgi:hypothetical protein
MASAPQFITTAKIGAVTVSVANTARDGTGTIATVFTAGSSGSKINEIVLKATGDPADSVVTLFLHDGSTYFLFDEVDLGDPAAASTTVASYRVSRTYSNLVLPSGWSLRAAITVALTAGVINAIALGGDF